MLFLPVCINSCVYSTDSKFDHNKPHVLVLEVWDRDGPNIDLEGGKVKEVTGKGVGR